MLKKTEKDSQDSASSTLDGRQDLSQGGRGVRVHQGFSTHVLQKVVLDKKSAQAAMIVSPGRDSCTSWHLSSLSSLYARNLTGPCNKDGHMHITRQVHSMQDNNCCCCCSTIDAQECGRLSGVC